MLKKERIRAEILYHWSYNRGRYTVDPELSQRGELLDSPLDLDKWSLLNLSMLRGSTRLLCSVQPLLGDSDDSIGVLCHHRY